MIVLAVMILPSIVKVSMTALEAVPREYEDASRPWGDAGGDVFPRVRSGGKKRHCRGRRAGVGRAIGEAMAG